MRRLNFLWAFALAASVSPATAQNTRNQQREAPEVRKLTISGVKHVDVHDLQTSISTQASKCRSLLLEPFCLLSHSPTFVERHYLDQQEFERDVLRIRLYYWKRGWRNVTVDTSVVKTGKRQVHVSFAVHEGEPTRIAKIAIVYDSTLISDRTRKRLTLLHAKDPLDLVMLDSTRLLFQNQLWDQGYGDAVVDTAVRVDSVARLGYVAITMTPNHRTTIGRIDINGNQKVSDKTILNSITFRTGDLYRQSAILESQRNLYESDLFRLVAIDVPPQYDSVKNVNIDVTESPLHDVRLGPGLTNVDFLQFQTHYTSYNLFGGARRLDVDFVVGNLLAQSLQGRGFFRNVRADVPDSNVAPYLAPTYNASIDFRQPAFLQRPSDAAGFGAFTHRTINPGVFIDRGFGGTATLTHQMAIRAPASLNYRYEVNRVQASDVYFCVNYGVCDTLTISTLRSHQSLSPLTLTGFVDRSDVPFEPTKGYVARLDLEHASTFTGSDYRYNRAVFDIAAYTHRTGSPRNVYSAHLSVGWVRALGGGTLHPRKRFYAGGANSVRGFGENMLGPRILTIDDSTLLKARSLPGGTCALTTTAVQYCDPNSPNLKNTDFLPQPLGGTSLLEGSVEARFPLPLGPTLRNFVGAVFLDGAVVGSAPVHGFQSLGNFVKGMGAVTPGFGIRYISPVGPIRVDFGINPSRTETLNVVTAVPDSTGQIRITPLATRRVYSPGHTLLDRLVLHFSIGEAY
ncbi:MAG TPA: BamA/TamA family outer membrane protein [Gemmatimonadaceae bacterium]|nr:BamA/TamA family outer membrane protein [Gemmatimonadaceae bacterium]